MTLRNPEPLSELRGSEVKLNADGFDVHDLGSHTANLDATAKVRTLRHDACGLRAHIANMGKRRWFLKEWRKHRGYTQERLADIIGSSKGYISELESGKRRYNEDLLDALADALRCDPADLLMRDPTDSQAIWSIWEVAKPGERRQIVEIAKTITSKTGTDD